MATVGSRTHRRHMALKRGELLPLGLTAVPGSSPLKSAWGVELVVVMLGPPPTGRATNVNCSTHKERFRGSESEAGWRVQSRCPRPHHPH